jgi:hypothetical protein
MSSHAPRPRHLTAAAIVLLGMVGVLAGTTGLSFGASAACGCQAAAIAEFEMKNPGGPFPASPAVGEERTIEIVNAGGAAGTPAGIPESETQGGIAVGGFFIVTGRAACATAAYAVGGTCSFNVKIAKVTAVGEAIVQWKATVTIGKGTNSQTLNV